MKAIHELPENYEDISHIHISKNKKSALVVNLTAAGIALIMILMTHLIVPLSSLIPEGSGAASLFARVAVLIPSIFLYVIMHEVIHGVGMKLLGCEQLNYVFSGFYISAGCRDFFRKNTFLLIDLAPVVLIGILLNVICFLVPISWFWVFYVLQIINIAGASGDYYIAYHLFAHDGDVLVRDAGTYIIVYGKAKRTETETPTEDEHTVEETEE
ncbi:MAG: DUF3267 domain-containing protein [Clostridia bacterium]|nr:DUF3267 domain-containing protein [Clostridia bacterium]